MERVRVVGLEVGVVDAVVDGLVNKRMVGIKQDKDVCFIPPTTDLVGV